MAIVLNRSCPAVSHNCTFTVFPLSKVIFLNLKSNPIVDKYASWKVPSVYLFKKQVLPTDESPNNNILNENLWKKIA